MCLCACRLGMVGLVGGSLATPRFLFFLHSSSFFSSLLPVARRSEASVEAAEFCGSLEVPGGRPRGWRPAEGRGRALGCLSRRLRTVAGSGERGSGAGEKGETEGGGDGTRFFQRAQGRWKERLDGRRRGIEAGGQRRSNLGVSSVL